MKILKISGRNLASLAGEFRVDFEQEPLASAGLFAITGPTGAGKSTLLDALCLALYDATPRLLKLSRSASLLPDVGTETVSAQDPRTLLRRGAAEGHAEVDFVGNDQQRYRARWSVRRARAKSAGGLQKSAMTLHRLPELVALGGTKTEVLDETQRRIGLSFEQFTRAVLLAQNEFSAFLKTEENERGELLETLTGSDIYSQLSKRAYERFRAEEQALKQLAARLADQAPLPADMRAETEANTATAVTALAAIELRRAALEQQLRWRQDADRLQQQLALADQALIQARLAAEDAGPQRRQLARVQAAQPARVVLAARERLAAEQRQAQAALAGAAASLVQARSQQQAAQAALAAGELRLQAAETARRNAAPQLDQAKALDASIGVLAPAHAAASAVLEQARERESEAAEARDLAAAQLLQTRADHTQDAAWLKQQQGWQVLAEQWPRWDPLLAKANGSAQDLQTCEAAMPGALEAESAALARHAETTQALAAHALRQASNEQARQGAIAALASFDGAAMLAARTALDLRRDQMLAGEKAWTELKEAGSRRAASSDQAIELAASASAAEAMLASAAAAQIALDASQAQAERSLRAAQLACAENVSTLRASLHDDEPCPVCGSVDHPYQHQDAALHAMFASLQQQLELCTGELSANLAQQAAQRAIAESSARQLDGAHAALSALLAAEAQLDAAWLAGPWAARAPESALRDGWFAQQLAAVRAASQDQQAQEQAAREAAVARDAAQQACDEDNTALMRLQEAQSGAASALAQASQARSALAAHQVQARTDLALLLDELEAAFPARDGWRAEWQKDTAQFHQLSQQQAQAWNEAAARYAWRASKLATLDAEQAGLAALATLASQAAAASAAAFAAIDADTGAKLAARRALFDGRPVQEAEAALDAAVGAARAALAEASSAVQHAVQADTRAREALAQGELRLADLDAQAAGASTAIALWLAAWPGRHPNLDAPENSAALETLLQYDSAWLAAQGQALAALDASAASAATILAERQAQYTLHLQSGDGNTPAAAALQASAAALQQERQAAADQAGALRLALAQDDARRASAQAVMADIERQQVVERRWAKLNDLIGSADGKKFRNYAQQFTLDVLLAYANSHLAQLARRYRLERVLQAGGPSLGLMVRDQDMGGEVRSVNSLSGGESFLVSLALALGLASLSSNRVRVESLFIDEGFGSLDSDTLRVAMDALDGLQAMGRKVGVISHVQEMTERIAVRIVVQPGGAGSSTVSVQ